jgi:hypothetical protein
MADKPIQEQEREYEPIRYLDSEKLEISIHDGGLRVVVNGTDTYDHVRAYACFPISNPHRHVSLRVGVTALEQREIGIIRDINQLRREQRDMVQQALSKRYFIHTITEIHKIREEFGFLYWEVVTDKGPRVFPVYRWDQGRVREFEGPDGEIGWTIIDTDKNRYEIPNISQLDPASRAMFYSKVYWGTHHE